MMRILLAVLLTAFTLGSVQAQSTESAEPVEREAMTAERMTAIIRHVDEDATVHGNAVEFVVDEYPVVLVYDEAADRMRLMVPAAKVDELKDGELLRLMQANFESALDARYAVAQGIVWGLFVHPLSTLSDEEFVVAIGQTVNVAATIGESYNSGVFVFGGGDTSSAERRKLIDRLKNLLRT